MAFEIENASLKSVTELIDDNKVENYETYRRIYDGDHYRGGDGWVGPRPSQTSLAGSPNATAILQEFEARIRKQFVSKNVVKEVVTRHTNGVLARTADLQILPAEGEMDPEDEEIILLEGYFRTWMRDAKVMAELKKSLADCLLGTRSVIRIFIPAGLTDDSGILESPEDIASALSLIHVESLSPDSAMIYIDPDTMQKYGLHYYTDDDDNEFVEITYIGEDGLTYVRVIGKDGIDEGEGIQLNGRLMMFEIERDRMITEQVKQNQELLNKNLTMWSANLDWSGFTERMILNGLPPGNWEKDDETGAMKYNREGDMITGPSQTNYIMGPPTYDENGNVTGMANPSVVFRDPIDPATFDRTLGACYTNILEECKQAHVILNSEETPSGISRREARQDFIDDLKDSKGLIDQAGEWIIETSYLLALDLIGQGQEEEKYRVNFDTVLQVGALSSEEQQQIIQQVDNKLLSVESAMRKLGIDDVVGELERIDSISDHLLEILSVYNEMGAISTTLYQRMVRILIKDKLEVFGDDLSEGELATIETELGESLAQSLQRNALLGGLDAPDEIE